MYNFQDESFYWRSWLIKEDALKTITIESSLQMCEFEFYSLIF
jgi:hypothetical protein